MKTVAKKTRRLGWMENYVGWAFCLPIIIGILTFTVVPIILSLYSTTLDWSGFQSIFDAESVGFDNFKNVFSGIYSANFYKAFGNTFAMMLYIPVQLFLGLLLAMGMNRKMRGAKTFRILYYLPSITSVVAITILFQKLFALDGTINIGLSSIGIGKVDWLKDSAMIKVTVNIMVIWKNVGFSSLMYVAGLQSVSTDQLEAARIDGAGRVRIFQKIILPAIYPVTFYLLVTGVMGGLQLFNEPFILAKYGAGNNAMTASSYIYYYYQNNQLGVAAVGAWMLALLIFVITAVQVIIDNRKEKY